ncbi:hypothetical protein Ri1_28030 [Aeromonas dhakensis]|nr:hypothetical protein Ri1_28030 [Aeromonas dhakensis]
MCSRGQQNCEPLGKSGCLALGGAYGGGAARDENTGREKSVHNWRLEKGVYTRHERILSD